MLKSTRMWATFSNWGLSVDVDVNWASPVMDEGLWGEFQPFKLLNTQTSTYPLSTYFSPSKNILKHRVKRVIDIKLAFTIWGDV